MSTVSARRGWSSETRFCVIVFGLAAAVHLSLSAIGLNNTLLGPHSFRQAQTAISTYYFVRDGVSLNYITPILGPPWQIPLEFPLFQACAAWFAKGTGLELDVAGRLTSWLFFVSLLPACYLLLRRFGVPPAHRLIFLALLLLSPIYIFFSRCFMIESAALSLAAWFLVCFDRHLERPRLDWLAGALVFGSLAGLVKVTTFAIFLVAALLLLFGQLRTPGSVSRLRLWLRAGVAVAVPLIATLSWVAYASVIRHRNPEADFLDRHFGFWSFGDLAQRLSPVFWTRTFGVWSGDIISEGGIVLLVLYFAWLRGRYRWAVTGCLVAFLSGQLIFSNLYFVHAYYFYASALFLVAALGFFLSELLLDSPLSVRSRWILTVIVLVLQVRAYTRTYLGYQGQNLPVPEAVAVLNAISKPDDIVVVVGQDWDCSFPYYAERHAFMLAKWREDNPVDVGASIRRLDPSKVAAVLIDRAHWRDGDFVRHSFGALDLGTSPFLFITDLGIWVPKSRQAAIRDEFDAKRFPSFQMISEANTTGRPRTLLARQIQRRAEFQGFHPRPIRATALNDFTMSNVNLQDVVSAHATTEFVFRTGVPTRHISAIYGILDGAYSGKASTDGVEFVVSAQGAGGKEHVLFRRFLDPLNHLSDRGHQRLDVTVEVAPGTEIYFRTLPGPANNYSFDWAYWGSITLAPTRP